MDAFDIPRLRGVTHAWAFWFALIAAAALIVFSPAGVARWAAAVYGVGLAALFGGSGLYHRWRWHPRWRPILRRIDHSMIFVFIAASYTPVGLLVLEGTTKWAVLIIVWSGAALGVGFSVAWISAPRSVCSACYVALGWAALACVPQLVHTLPAAPLVLMGLGGLLYTAGAIIYALGRPNPWPKTFGFHEIFHVFVILAAVAHFVAMAGWIVAA